MGILTSEDYTELRKIIYRQGVGKEELKALPYLPNKNQLKAVFQEIEDYWENTQATLKSDMDTAMGQTITNALAKKFGKAWMKWKRGL